MERWTIYCHTHIRSGRRYIGLTKKTMMHRWNRHIYHALKRNDGSHFQHAIRLFGKDAFSHEVLEVCHDLKTANLAEECWIEFYETRNPEKGFNLAKGGSHTPHPKKNPWDRPGFREKVISSLTGRKASPEAIRANCSSHIGLKLSDEARRKISEANSSRSCSDETKAKLRQAMTGRTLTEEQCAKVGDANRRRIVSDETRAKISAASTGRKHTPESRAKMSEIKRRKQPS